MTKMYEAGDHILICTGYPDPAEHCHRAAHIIVSMGNKMKAGVGGKEFFCRGIRIPSGVSHHIETDGEPVLVFLYDCTTAVAKQIREVSCLSEAVCDRIKELYLEFEKKNTPREYTLFEESSLKQLGLAKGASCVTDERILTAIRRIRTMPSEKISCREMAGTVFLSQSRFAHLFREQTGMTFAAYLIYQRLICAYTAVLRGKTITDAALEAGFSGSAHFADINRRVFGLSARNITKDLIFAKV